VKPHDPAPSFVTRHRFILLFVALLVFFVVVPIVHQVREALHPATAPFIEGFLFVAVLVGVVVSISTSWLSKVVALGFGLPLAVLIVLHAFSDWTWVAIFRHLWGAAFLGYAIVVMLLFILTSRQITFNTVCASLCIYMLLGLLWALGYSVIDQLDPAAFLSSTPHERLGAFMRIGKGEPTAVLYFSFATLTTLGYGDIVPISPIARTLATLEAITGQLYLAVLVARLVGLHIADSIQQKQEATADTDVPTGQT
jgi:hypothetical protein